MLSWIRSPGVALVFRCFLGALFLYAGYLKAADPEGLAQAIYNYLLLPGWSINPLAVALPWIEIGIGLALLSGVWVAGAALAASGLFAVFAAALGISLIRGLDIACGCFSSGEAAGPINGLYLLRDLSLLGMAVQTFLFDQGWAPLRRIIPAWKDRRATGRVSFR